MQSEISEGWTPVVDLDSKSLVGTTERNIVLRHDALHAGKKCKLICRVKTEGELCRAQNIVCSEWKKRNKQARVLAERQTPSLKKC